MIEQFERQKATDLENAWLNFEPDPLPSDNHPFYEHRPGEPLERLIIDLRLSVQKASLPKCFFTGYRGSGKSTELNRLAENERIQQRYWIVRFSIKETGDIQNLDYTDILLSLGAQMYTQYVDSGGKLKGDLLKELETWKDRTVERLRSKGAVFETGAGFDLSHFFVTTLLKIKTEHETRELIRDEIRPRLSELLEKISLIAAGIQSREKKPVLVLIDDLDKLNLDNARKVFYENLTALLQPSCAIVYTLPVALLYEDIFMVAPLFQDAFFLPNVRLHPKGNREQKDAGGYQFLGKIISRRIDMDLFAGQVVDALINLSGGVPSELIFAVQTAISNALHRGGDQISMEDVEWARGQLRNPLLRLLSDDDLRILREIRLKNPERLSNPKSQARLVHIRAALQYANGLDWFDTHPALDEVLAESLDKILKNG